MIAAKEAEIKVEQTKLAEASAKQKIALEFE